MKQPWTKEEDEILIYNYPLEGPSIVSKLKNRTVNAIKNRAQTLGIIYRKEMFGWSPEELNILKEYYPIEGKKILERLPGRTLKTIQVTAHRLGIKRQYPKGDVDNDNFRK